MRAKVQYSMTKYREADVELDDADLLAWVNAGGGDYETLDDVRADDREDLDQLIVEFLEETGFHEHVLTNDTETGDDFIEFTSAKEA